MREVQVRVLGKALCGALATEIQGDSILIHSRFFKSLAALQVLLLVPYRVHGMIQMNSDTELGIALLQLHIIIER